MVRKTCVFDALADRQSCSPGYGTSIVETLRKSGMIANKPGAITKKV
jgi:DNA-binding IscR family transcriptional regulator